MHLLLTSYENQMKTNNIIITCLAVILILYSCQDESGFQPLKAEFKASISNVKSGESVTFSDLSSGNVASWNWEFEGGTPDTSILSGPTIVYHTPGAYSVTLRISNLEYEDEIIKETLITVGYSEVAANFESSLQTVMEGEEVEFTDLSEGYVEGWSWEFYTESGARLTSSEQNPTVRFDEAGIYWVKLLVSNAEFSNEKIVESLITVLDPADMEPNFGANFTGTYEGGAVTFSDQSIGLVTDWAWEFEGGIPATSSESQPTVTYNTAGRYKVKLVASNSVVSKEVVKEAYVVVVPADGLTAYFPFGGSLNDAGPNQLESESTGTVTIEGSDRNNNPGDAAVFDGSGGLVIPDHEAFNFGTENYSIACWIKTDRSNRMMIWQESGDRGSKDNQTWMRLGANTTTQLLGFATEDANGGSFLGLSEAEGGKMYDEVWHHVVCVREGLKTRVYVDGARAKEVTSSKGIKDVSNSEPFKIGMQGGSNGYFNYYNGLLDDMIIYKKALSETEILELFNL